MAQCDANHLFAASKCFACLTPAQLQIVATALLCEVLMQAKPMATCNVNDLLNAGKCFTCLTGGQLQVIQTQLLCEILSVGAMGLACVLCGSGAPTQTPNCDCAIYYTLAANPGVWIWDYVNGVWDQVIAPGP